ncbi:MAG: hypothetical protein JSS91_14315 [Bacteroidetes bacterium]|nr:hypothetical protein [Bacteroidota bacterium]
MTKHFFRFILVCVLISQGYSFAQDTISPPNPGGITKVYISMIINNISEINAANQTVTADIVLSARWNDPRLKNESKGNIVVSADKIWDPFLTFTNRLNITKSFPENFTILNDGTVLYFQRIFGSFTQVLQFKDFPFDEQQFKIRILDITLNPNDVILEPDPIRQSGLGKDITLADWNIEKWSFENSLFTIMENSPERSTLLFTIYAKRESGYYMLIFFIPLVLIITMSLLAFWLPANLSASQITVGTTSMLTLIAYRFIVVANLPKISYMTRMDIFILGSSVLIFLTLLESVITSTLANKGRNELAQKYDNNCRWIFPLLYLILGLSAFIL